MKDTNKVAVCLIKNEKGKYLMTLPSKYKNYGKYQDAWCFPSGHVKDGETVQECLIREVSEELNIVIEPTKLVSKWEQDIPGEIAYWWECKVIDGNPARNYEIAKYDWFSPEEIKSLKIWPAMEKFLKKFIWK